MKHIVTGLLVLIGLGVPHLSAAQIESPAYLSRNADWTHLDASNSPFKLVLCCVRESNTTHF